MLDEMLEAPTDNGLQSAPLPNRKWLSDLRLHEFYGSSFTRERVYGGTSEIMKTIIARDLTGLRT